MNQQIRCHLGWINQSLLPSFILSVSEHSCDMNGAGESLLTGSWVVPPASAEILKQSLLKSDNL